MSIEQIVTTSGDGKLRDQSECSDELRSFFAQVGSDKLAEYAEHCLAHAFNKGGMVLQDIVNELGRRLDYSVVNGRYQGTSNSVGYDGLWVSPENHHLVIEVKTTDAYRLPLDTIANYRDKLLSQQQLGEPNSMLMIVGREDTGELEAQVRGSRHAWDMRLISVESLIRLVKLKENTEEPATVSKIRSLLIPREYTRVDGLIDIIFTAATDVEKGAEGEKHPGEEKDEGSKWEFTDRSLLDDKRAAIISAFASGRDVKLIKRSRALYWTADHTVRVGCTVSKRYDSGVGSAPYWYAYHPRWDAFLGEAESAYLILGCMDLSSAFAIPLEAIRERLKELNLTPLSDGKSYWHLKIIEQESGYALHMPKTGNHMSLSSYVFDLDRASFN
jgi:hypothetical protein